LEINKLGGVDKVFRPGSIDHMVRDRIKYTETQELAMRQRHYANKRAVWMSFSVRLEVWRQLKESIDLTEHATSPAIRAQSRGWELLTKRQRAKAIALAAEDEAKETASRR